MNKNGFQRFIVWEKGHELVLDIYRVSKTFPSYEKFGLTSQIRRSAASICANIAEGYMKSRKDFARFLDISRGSLEETKYHLILSKDLGYLDIPNFNRLSAKADEIGKILYAFKQKL